MSRHAPALIITKLILNTIYFTDIKYYLILHYIKLGMTMNKHNVLKNNNIFTNNIKFIKYFIYGQNY